jgi:hypothetical protein
MSFQDIAALVETNLMSGHIGQRFFYVEKNQGQSILGYCEKEKAWTHIVCNQTCTTPDPCTGWYAISASTQTYDITKTTDWRVYSAKTGIVDPFSHFHLECIDCVGGDRGTCNTDHCTCVNVSVIQVGLV